MRINRKEKSSHWYHRDGTSCHEVIAKTTGLPRPTTVADARKLNRGQPTTVEAMNDDGELETVAAFA